MLDCKNFVARVDVLIELSQCRKCPIVIISTISVRSILSSNWWFGSLILPNFFSKYGCRKSGLRLKQENQIEISRAP